MNKRSAAARRMSTQEAASAAAGAIVSNDKVATGVQAFTFGDPEPVLDRRELLDLVECPSNGRWYAPPISLDGLARAYRVSPHHSSAIIVKRKQLVASFVPSTLLSRRAFEAIVQDYLVFGNAYLERRDNLLGTPLRLDHALAKNVRRGVVPGEFFFTQAGGMETPFRPGSVLQLMQPDVNQEIYGIPEYISAMQSALLNENATLFRRRYYLNGSHAGFILHAVGDFANGDVDNIKDALTRSKGPGNFRNLFLHQPGGVAGSGTKDGSLKLIPIAEVGAKDEFLGIKNTTRDDVLAAHRVPPQVMGIVPANAGGFGDPAKAVDMFHELEIVPLQPVFLEINDWIGAEAVAFRRREASAGVA